MRRATVWYHIMIRALKVTLTHYIALYSKRYSIPTVHRSLPPDAIVRKMDWPARDLSRERGGVCFLRVVSDTSIPLLLPSTVAVFTPFFLPYSYHLLLLPFKLRLLKPITHRTGSTTRLPFENASQKLLITRTEQALGMTLRNGIPTAEAKTDETVNNFMISMIRKYKGSTPYLRSPYSNGNALVNGR